MTPIGEYIRYLVISRLAKGPATVDELNSVVEDAVRRLGVNYNWRIWPELVKREVAFDGNTAKLTERGRWVAAVGLKAMARYVQRTLGRVTLAL
ncbi:hypothetical protein [Thermoproteus tenax]|uniref:Uncharacterized protein n=1 Tax=Thermoproteus tenax (strain ATCC 35583 / DSM 2078 / JCM 9277 / NBRC 100435 / Kra 1) TaxID=768679 RepID=G4RL83_THETK|nr:hypothetical protein [Thermoproteus tenax]CCC82328.1 conserved hypothetical protein [Thermoproteus tenax Kra 1]